MSDQTAESSTVSQKRKLPVKQGDEAPVLHHTFDPTDAPILPKPPKAPKIDPAPAPATTSVPVEKKSKAKITLFNNIDVTKFTLGPLNRTPKNLSKYVSVDYLDGSELILTPKLYLGYGFFKNDMAYSLSPILMGVPPNRKPNDEITLEQQANPELLERIAMQDMCNKIDEFIIDQAVINSMSWFGREVPRERLAKMMRPTATPNVDKITEEEYCNTIRFTFPMSMQGKPQFKVYYDKGGDVDPDELVKKELKQWCKIGFTFKKITFPNTGTYKFGLQCTAHQMVLFQGKSDAFLGERLLTME